MWVPHYLQVGNQQNLLLPEHFIHVCRDTDTEELVLCPISVQLSCIKRDSVATASASPTGNIFQGWRYPYIWPLRSSGLRARDGVLRVETHTIWK